MALRSVLLAGLFAAMAAPALAQTTPPQTSNDQNQSGDLRATMTVDNRQGGGSGSVSSSALAAGNTTSAANLTGGLNLRSRQTFSGSAFATANALADDACCHAVSVANAQGNALEAQSVGGASTHDLQQLADGGDVSSAATVNIRSSQNISASANSALNNAATRTETGSHDLTLTQDSGASAYAAVDVDACCSGQTVASASSSINAWSAEARTATTRSAVNQTSSGAASQAAVDVYQVQGYEITAAATAAANSATLDSEYGYAELRARQNSSTNVQADTRLQLNSWQGNAVSSAYGVGNAVLATNVGSDLNVDINQVNTGGVSASASFTGGTGGVQSGVAILNSAAIGNASTTWVCSVCGDASAYGSVIQNNAGAITSTGTITTLGATGAVGSASAVGNSSTWVTTQRQN